MVLTSGTKLTMRPAFPNRCWPTDHFATAPESPFADGPSVSLATEAGYRKLEPRRLIERRGDRRTERPVDAAEWRARLRSAFGIDPAFDG